MDYRRRFIELMAPLDGIPESIAQSQYINGLKDDVKAELRLLGPHTLDSAMDLSIKVEEKLQFGLGKKNEPKYPSNPNPWKTGSVSPSYSNHKKPQPPKLPKYHKQSQHPYQFHPNHRKTCRRNKTSE